MIEFTYKFECSACGEKTEGRVVNPALPTQFWPIEWAVMRDGLVICNKHAVEIRGKKLDHSAPYSWLRTKEVRATCWVDGTLMATFSGAPPEPQREPHVSYTVEETA